MIYGNATLAGLPWEVVIKGYRHQFDKKPFDHLDSYLSDFLDFVQDKSAIFSDEQKSQNIQRLVLNIYQENVQYPVQQKLEQRRGELTASIVNHELRKQINRFSKRTFNEEYLDGYDINDHRNAKEVAQQTADDLCAKLLKDHRIAQSYIQKLKN